MRLTSGEMGRLLKQIISGSRLHACRGRPGKLQLREARCAAAVIRGLQLQRLVADDAPGRRHGEEKGLIR